MRKKIIIITPKPILISTFTKESIINKAIKNNIIKVEIVNLRRFGLGKSKQIDDKPFGGLPGMVLMAKPLSDAIEYSFNLLPPNSKDVDIIFPSPQGRIWKQNFAHRFSKRKNIIFICGHYKGIDERIFKKYLVSEYSIGDFILTGGEIPALIMIDSIVRLIPGTLNNLESANTDSHTDELLDNPYYTQPRRIFGLDVPEVLLSGHHSNIEAWRSKKKIEATKNKRPDIYKKYKNNLKMEH